MFFVACLAISKTKTKGMKRRANEYNDFPKQANRIVDAKIQKLR
jgi:hypothetical protein